MVRPDGDAQECIAEVKLAVQVGPGKLPQVAGYAAAPFFLTGTKFRAQAPSTAGTITLWRNQMANCLSRSAWSGGDSGLGL